MFTPCNGRCVSVNGVRKHLYRARTIGCENDSYSTLLRVYHRLHTTFSTPACPDMRVPHATTNLWWSAFRKIAEFASSYSQALTNGCIKTYTVWTSILFVWELSGENFMLSILTAHSHVGWYGESHNSSANRWSYPASFLSQRSTTIQHFPHQHEHFICGKSPSRNNGRFRSEGAVIAQSWHKDP